MAEQFMQVSMDYIATLKTLDGIAKQQFPFAFSNALNDTAFDVKRYYQGQLPGILDRPTSFTLNGMYVKKATKRDMYAFVGFKEFASKGTPAVKYMSHLNTGGKRMPKRSEVLLRSKGIIKSGQHLIPAKRYQNASGNVTKSMVSKMLSSIQATFDTQQYSKGAKAKQFFVNKLSSQKHFGPHVYVRTGKRMRLFMWVVDDVSYKPILDYEVLTTRRAESVFGNYFDFEMSYAMGTAI